MGRERTDRYGFDDTRDYVAETVGTFVPQWLARRAIAVSVRADRARYAPGGDGRIGGDHRRVPR